MKRLLIISYYWPPTGGSGVQRWVKFAKYLPSFGWQPVVYTPENPEQLAVDESLLSDVPEEAEIIKTHITEPYGLYRKFFGGSSKSTEKGTGLNPLNSQKKSWKQKLAVLLRGNLFVPDPRVWWVRPSVKYLKDYLEKHPVDAMVTTGPPQSMHLIGLGLKKAMGDKAPRWIVDFRDPWTQMFYFKHLGLLPLAERKHRRLEQRVLDAADDIISVTPLVQADFQAATKTPVHLITNGFDPSDYPESKYVPGERFTIVHTGLFASDGNPLALWDILSEKCAADLAFAGALRIILAGKVDPEIVEAVRSRGLEANLELPGYLPHEATVALQSSASMLILPLRREPEYRKVLPGKIFEYLAARRPVLGIGQEDGAAATVLRTAGSGEMYDWENREPMELFLGRQWKSFLEGDCSPVGNDIDTYSRITLTGRLAGLLAK